MTTTREKQGYLISQGWIVGERDPLIHPKVPGTFMCKQPLPGFEGCGPVTMVGDNLEHLIAEAYAYLTV